MLIYGEFTYMYLCVRVCVFWGECKYVINACVFMGLFMFLYAYISLLTFFLDRNKCSLYLLKQKSIFIKEN